MHTTPSKPVSPESLHDGYEVSDLKASLIVVVLAVVGLMGAAAFPIILWLVTHWDQTRSPYDVTPKSIVSMPLDQVPPTPHLQQWPRRDAQQHATDFNEYLNTYGIVAESDGMKTAHIPVEHAIDLVAEGKVAYRQQPVIATTAPAATEAPAAAPVAAPAPESAQ